MNTHIIGTHLIYFTKFVQFQGHIYNQSEELFVPGVLSECMVWYTGIVLTVGRMTGYFDMLVEYLNVEAMIWY